MAIDRYVWAVRGAIAKMRVRRMHMIYTFEGFYWRTLCLSQHTSVLRLGLLQYIAIENSYASISAALVRTCDQVCKSRGPGLRVAGRVKPDTYV